MTTRIFVITALAFLCAACTTLGGEPRIVATIPPATETPAPLPDIGQPAAPPDLVNGAKIYAENCAACHGDSGKGDGPVALDTEGMEPRDFTDPESARSQTPHEWFRTITNGNIEKLMPPWRNVLTEQQRLTHEVKDLTDQDAMITLSDGSIFNMVTQGFEDVMPSYEELSEEDRWAVTEFARTLSLGAMPWQTGSDATPVAARPHATGGRGADRVVGRRRYQRRRPHRLCDRAAAADERTALCAQLHFAVCHR
jgi:mono/diheme cytochrome c family protein